MGLKLKYRRAVIDDLSTIINLLANDELGQQRERDSKAIDQSYLDAFSLIDSDPNQYLMVVEVGNQIVSTCHLTIMHSLTFMGKTRMQIEAVRVLKKLRGHKIGEWMIIQAIEYAKSRGASIIQLTTNVNRPIAIIFYEHLGFESTHVGMKFYLEK